MNTQPADPPFFELLVTDPETGIAYSLYGELAPDTPAWIIAMRDANQA
jgi:hypothetical protein